ncbi:hypothetical protein FB559_8703 [Actinoallomurus bryophytorum]|uniref:Uncharacterized protein n=1 Tax=Actinoallomurus bryophytorum TaxID=1490222 RepID=A0A543BTD0_9ACTN|nr:hypothetical protein FB559_8703 [Actinoallomurus bryophytorum]
MKRQRESVAEHRAGEAGRPPRTGHRRTQHPCSQPYASTEPGWYRPLTDEWLRYRDSRWSMRVRRITSADSGPAARSGPAVLTLALVEDQVEGVQDRAEPLGAVGGHRERDAAVLDGLLGPADAPGHRRFGDQERAGDRDAVRWPLEGGGEQCLLRGVLGGVEVAEAPYDRAEDLRRQVARQVLDPGRRSGQRSSSVRDPATGRTSMTLETPAGPGHWVRPAAISVARSKPSHSTIQ